MFIFDSSDSWAIPIRGDIGVRYVQTDQFAAGVILVASPPTSVYISFA